MSHHELLAAVRETREHITEQIKSRDERINNLEAQMREHAIAGNRPGYLGGPSTAGGPGEEFVNSRAYKEMAEKGVANSDPVPVKSWRTKALTSEAGSGGELAQPDRYGPIVGPGQRAFILRDLLSVQSTSSNSVEYTRETGFTGSAAVVPEGEEKPEMELSFEVVTAPVRTIATTLTATNQALADVNQLSAHINQRLAYAVGQEEERQLLYGSGVNPNLQGIMTHEGVQVHEQGEDTKIDAIRRAMTRARVAEYPVTGLVIHPEDWMEIELTKDTQGRFLYISQPSEGGAGTFWRLPVVESTAIEQGVALVGAFALGAAIHDRESASVRTSEHHNDYFRRNLVLLRGESRIALSVYRPEAFVKINFTDSAA